MRNHIKANLYRMFHQKSFYISLLVLLLFYLMVMHNIGVMSSSVFVTFTQGKDNLGNFLYYIPRSPIFLLGVLVFIAMFDAEEYTSRMAASLYPLQHSKWKILVSQWFLHILTFLLFNFAIALMTGMNAPFFQDAFAGFDVVSYVWFVLIQALLYGAILSFQTLILHLTQTRLTIVILAVLYGCSMVYMFMAMGVELLHIDPKVLTYTLYACNGSLPAVFAIDTYKTALCCGIGYTILYNVISLAVLKKKDLA